MVGSYTHSPFHILFKIFAKKDIWESIQRDSNDRFQKCFSREMLQTKFNRGRSRNIEWIDKDGPAILKKEDGYPGTTRNFMDIHRWNQKMTICRLLQGQEHKICIGSEEDHNGRKHLKTTVFYLLEWMDPATP
ncbi:hypothetical protein FSPOR_8028 [Fusarium sporotrichioides]|uniref:Uncharacterized protein n=1 Tax=Fusarium sporotrichioides TaxID=5514 RepID=A0A395RWL5_FUSSP|nr:hypothetical protein FSPOR_8028 [Fusarium sporotrichioides]